MSYYHNYNEGTLASNSEVVRGTGTASIPGKDDDRKLFVGDLSWQTTDKELREYFGKFGNIESVNVKVDPYTGQPRGFAFIVFSDAKAIETLLASGDHYINNRKVDPRKVSIKPPEPGQIFVGGLTPEMTDADINNYFSQFGTVVEVKSPFDKLKNQRKEFCFITFESKDVVYKLLKTPKQVINGKAVDVKNVKSNPFSMWMGNRYYQMPWIPNVKRFSNHYGYAGDYLYDGYADYGYCQPFSGVANNYAEVPKASGGNSTSGAGGGSSTPPVGSGGAGSSGTVRQFSGVGNNYAGVRPKASGGNSTSGGRGGSGGAGSSGAVRQFSSVADNYAGVRPKASGGNSTSGAGSSGAVRHFQEHKPY